MYQIRAQRDSADLQEIGRLASVIWPEVYSSIISREQIAYMLDLMYSIESLEKQRARGDRFLLLEEESGKAERAVGFASYQPGYKPGTSKLHKLYVLPGLHGRGLGRMLIREVMELSSKSGDSVLRLDVNYRNPARYFYERLGFNKVDEVTTEIGQGYLMEDYVYEIQLGAR